LEHNTDARRLRPARGLTSRLTRSRWLEQPRRIDVRCPEPRRRRERCDERHPQEHGSPNHVDLPRVRIGEAIVVLVDVDVTGLVIYFSIGFLVFRGTLL
jgi:hypothetical protein